MSFKVQGSDSRLKTLTMKKETQVKNGASANQPTPAPHVKSANPEYDKFVQQALQTVFKPKK
jgi:hypothetical protein